MKELPEPLTPADCDVRDYPYMPLYINRLRDSTFAVKVEPSSGYFAFFAWVAAFHQVPAASLPDDEAELARLLGLGRDVEKLREVREGALYGFIKSNDGRLYHPVVAEAARNAWADKQARRVKKDRYSERAKRGAAKRWAGDAERESDAQAMFGAAASNASSINQAMPVKKGKAKKEKEALAREAGSSSDNLDSSPQCQHIRKRLALRIEQKSYDQWIYPLRITVAGNEVIAIAETSFDRDYVRNQFAEDFRVTAQAVLGSQATVIFQCRGQKAK